MNIIIRYGRGRATNATIAPYAQPPSTYAQLPPPYSQLPSLSVQYSIIIISISISISISINKKWKSSVVRLLILYGTESEGSCA